MIRYWHWLVSQKKPETEYYVVDGTMLVHNWFDPEDYEESDNEGYININTEQDGNNSGE